MKILSTGLLIVLAGCASAPAVPDWQDNAHAALASYTSAYLKGNTRIAELDFTRVRSEISSTGRADLLARAELVRCAVRVASLELDDCAGFKPLWPDAAASERSYAAYLTNHWQAVDPALLPPQHRAVVASTGASAALLGQIGDPLARLVAAGALFQAGRLAPADLLAATETASAQGWRRPLLAWLGVQAMRARDAGDQAALALLQRRIDLVSASLQ